MCKVYDAIYDLVSYVESNVLICCMGHMKIEGELHKCMEEFNENECYDGVITLKDVKVTCHDSEEVKEYKWLNIAAKHIEAFAFKCCEK